MPAPAKAKPLPGADHALRYIAKKHVDRETKQVNGAGFLPRSNENDGASCNWMECFDQPVANQCGQIRARKRIQYEKRGKLARLNVKDTTTYVNKEATLPTALLFVHDPYPPEDPPEDASHSLMIGLPKLGSPDHELVGDLFLDCIVETFEVIPD